jgi:hypothetical protein
VPKKLQNKVVSFVSSESVCIFRIVFVLRDVVCV